MLFGLWHNERHGGGRLPDAARRDLEWRHRNDLGHASAGRLDHRFRDRRAQPLPFFVGAGALGLGTDLEDRQDLEARTLDAAFAQEGEEAIAARLTAPIVSLSVATRAVDMPRWMAEGVGMSTASRQRGSSRDRSAKAKLEAELSAAFAAMDNAKKFLDGKMTPKQADLIGAAIATSMMDRGYRRAFDGLLRQLDEGVAFEQAFLQAFNMPLEAFVGKWLKYARG